MADSACGESSSKTKTNRISKDHKLKKRPSQKPEIAKNVIYVSTKSNIKAELEKCQKLIKENEEEIIIYCMGAAIQRGILLALQLCEKNLSYQISPNTFTSELIDDLEPATDDVDYEIQKRQNSALRIRIFKADLLKTDA